MPQPKGVKKSPSEGATPPQPRNKKPRSSKLRGQLAAAIKRTLPTSRDKKLFGALMASPLSLKPLACLLNVLMTNQVAELLRDPASLAETQGHNWRHVKELIRLTRMVSVSAHDLDGDAMTDDINITMVNASPESFVDAMRAAQADGSLKMTVAPQDE